VADVAFGSTTRLNEDGAEQGLGAGAVFMASPAFGEIAQVRDRQPAGVPGPPADGSAEVEQAFAAHRGNSSRISHFFSANAAVEASLGLADEKQGLRRTRAAEGIQDMPEPV